ncbi:MAG: winged helix-turn-helix transcriptional regulator [Phycisphaerales bacterium]|nr:MAG: winged helix-turn-helix transcriptional regulator [Phycisphaerales bacterium]
MSKRPSQRPRPVRSGRKLAALFEAGFFKALGDPGRIGILCRLATLGGPATVSELAGCCPQDVSVVCRHLAMLKRAGILQSQKRGKEVYYSVRFPEFIDTLRAMANALETCCGLQRSRKKRGKS